MSKKLRRRVKTRRNHINRRLTLKKRGGWGKKNNSSNYKVGEVVEGSEVDDNLEFARIVDEIKQLFKDIERDEAQIKDYEKSNLATWSSGFYNDYDGDDMRERDEKISVLFRKIYDARKKIKILEQQQNNIRAFYNE